MEIQKEENSKKKNTLNSSPNGKINTYLYVVCHYAASTY